MVQACKNARTAREKTHAFYILYIARGALLLGLHTYVNTAIFFSLGKNENSAKACVRCTLPREINSGRPVVQKNSTRLKLPPFLLQRCSETTHHDMLPSFLETRERDKREKKTTPLTFVSSPRPPAAAPPGGPFSPPAPRTAASRCPAPRSAP